MIPVPPAPVVTLLPGGRVPVLDAGAADPTHGGETLIETREHAARDAAAVGILGAPRVPGTCRARTRVAGQSHDQRRKGEQGDPHRRFLSGELPESSLGQAFRTMLSIRWATRPPSMP